MKTEEYVALGGLITIIASAMALIIKQLESSKCTDINCLCVKCKRKVKLNTEESKELKDNIKKELKDETQPEPEPEPEPQS